MQLQRVGLRPAQAPFRHATRAPFTPARQVVTHHVCSAASEDPYRVLGLDRAESEGDSAAIDKAYRVSKYAARYDNEKLKKIEEAHNALMLSSLTSRLKGKGVNKSIAFADQEPLFPWRPKRWDATPKVIMVIGAMQLGMVAYGFQQPSLSKTIFCGLIGIVANVMKQNAIAPPPSDPEMASEEEGGRASKNFVRGFLLAILATIAGTLVFSAPEYLVQKFKVVLPTLPGAPNPMISLKILGSALFNWVITSFYY